jgi:hypothetical protein
MFAFEFNLYRYASAWACDAEGIRSILAASGGGMRTLSLEMAAVGAVKVYSSLKAPGFNPELESAWFQPLNMKCDLFGFKMCFQMGRQLVELRGGGVRVRGEVRGDVLPGARGGGPVQLLKIQLIHSLQGACFQPLSLSSDLLVSKCAFK